MQLGVQTEERVRDSDEGTHTSDFFSLKLCIIRLAWVMIMGALHKSRVSLKSNKGTVISALILC